MFSLNKSAHIQFLKIELNKLLPEGTFASRLRLTIGQELHDRLVDWPDEEETEYSSLFPVDALFTWAVESGGLDPEWLASENGNYLDDNGSEILSNVKPALTSVEQLAAYGVWLLDEMLNSYGPISEDEANFYGWSREDITEHQASCILFAYQALSYCHRIRVSGSFLTPDEVSRAATFNFSKMGKEGAKKRHASMNLLRTWAVQKYRERDWKSANQAAHALKDEVIQHGRTINAHLSEENAQRTLAEWFRKSV